MRFFSLVVAIIGIIVSILWWYNSEQTAISNDQMAHALRLAIIVLLLTSSILASNIKIGELLRHCLVWFTLTMILLISYQHRYYLQDIGHLLTAGIIPPSPLSRYDSSTSTVTVLRDRSGHFETHALVNGKPMRFLIDTGASRVVLSHMDAVKVGINVDTLRYSITTSTANGLAQAAPIQLQSIAVGSIERNTVPALVARPDSLSSSLLGMSFLNSLSGYTVRADQLTLVD